MITYRLMRKDYDYLARCLVPIGEEQVRMGHREKVEMLRKTRMFGEEGAVLVSQDTFYVVRGVRSLRLGRAHRTRLPEHNLMCLVVGN